MARQTVYVVVRRHMAYNDNWHDWTGAEAPVKAYRTRERAEEVALQLSQETDPNRWRREEGWNHIGLDHVVMPVEVDLEGGRVDLERGRVEAPTTGGVPQRPVPREVG
jgi:hypothetical protein